MSKKVGNTHFTAKGYEKFVTLTKAEQIETIKGGFYPVNMKKIEEALKNVPNGDKSSRNAAKATKSNGAEATGKGSGTGGSGQGAENKESQD